MAIESKAGAGAGAHAPRVTVENGTKEDVEPHLDFETNKIKQGD